MHACIYTCMYVYQHVSTTKTTDALPIEILRVRRKQSIQFNDQCRINIQDWSLSLVFISLRIFCFFLRLNSISEASHSLCHRSVPYFSYFIIVWLLGFRYIHLHTIIVKISQIKAIYF